MEIIGFVTGSVFGAVIIWFVMKSASAKSDELLNNRILDLDKEKESLTVELRGEIEKTMLLSTEIATLKATNENLNKTHVEQDKILRERFENLANDILDKKSQKFTDQNEKNLRNLLNPLKDKIENFEEKVERSNAASLKWNTELKTQIQGLADLNRRINKEAENLTRANAYLRWAVPWDSNGQFRKESSV